MKPGSIKCVVWDLDNTVWDGVLLENDELRPRTDTLDAIRRLDRRGVLNSIASRNDPEAAYEQLRKFGIEDLFVYPQIGWNPKSASVREVARSINIGLDAVAFVDDQPFELAEVAHSVPEVVCVDVAELADVIDGPGFTPRFVTGESAHRREMYRHQVARDTEQEAFVGTDEEFLAGLDMVFTIAAAGEDDLQRAEELTVRTNQLNSTGRTYSYEELDALRGSDDHVLLVASLHDRFGTYGTIGLSLIEKGDPAWNLRLLLMSCRVVSRGVGTIMLNHVKSLARDAGAVLRADFVETGRNRMMQITYGFAGFAEVARDGSAVVLECDPANTQPQPSYVRVIT